MFTNTLYCTFSIFMFSLPLLYLLSPCSLYPYCIYYLHVLSTPHISTISMFSLPLLYLLSPCSLYSLPLLYLLSPCSLYSLPLLYLLSPCSLCPCLVTTNVLLSRCKILSLQPAQQKPTSISNINFSNLNGSFVLNN